MDKKLGNKSVEMLQKKFFCELGSLIVKVFRVRKYYSCSKAYSHSTVYDSTSS
jgi:hypothetical protein